jgi:nucleotide-binding universal stress UspA family protein
MIKIERILCPTNLSSESDEALRYGVALASAYHAKLFLLYCGEVAPAGVELVGDGARAHVRRLFEQGIMRHLGLTHLAGLDWEGIVVESGNAPGEEIVREAAERRVDLIVMRSRRRPRAAALLGSTAEQVYRTAPCPVLVTHPHEQEWVSFSTGEIDLRRVLVAHDFSTDSELAVRYGVSLAEQYGAELHLMHVLARPETDGPEIAWGPESAESAYHAAARRLRQAVSVEANLSCKVVHTVRWGKPYQEVLSYAKEQEIDVICMGAKGKNFSMGALFGSNVDRVLRQSPCPALVARPLRPAVSASSQGLMNHG